MKRKLCQRVFELFWYLEGRLNPYVAHPCAFYSFLDWCKPLAGDSARKTASSKNLHLNMHSTFGTGVFQIHLQSWRTRLSCVVGTHMSVFTQGSHKQAQHGQTAFHMSLNGKLPLFIVNKTMITATVLSRFRQRILSSDLENHHGCV